MLYVQLDTNWPDNPKVARVGIDGAGAHAVVLCLAKRLESDGWVDLFILSRYGVTADLVARLQAIGLLERDGERVRPSDWHDRNPSQAAIAARRAGKAEAGKRGNHAKWKHPHPFESCPTCHPDLLVVAPCDRSGSHSETEAIAVDRTPTKSESETEVTPAIPPTIVLEPYTPPRIPAKNAEEALAALTQLRERRTHA